MVTNTVYDNGDGGRIYVTSPGGPVGVKPPTPPTRPTEPPANGSGFMYDVQGTVDLDVPVPPGWSVDATAAQFQLVTTTKEPLGTGPLYRRMTRLVGVTLWIPPGQYWARLDRYPQDDEIEEAAFCYFGGFVHSVDRSVLYELAWGAYGAAGGWLPGGWVLPL